MVYFIYHGSSAKDVWTNEKVDSYILYYAVCKE